VNIRVANFKDFESIRAVCNRNHVTHPGHSSCMKKTDSIQVEYDRFVYIWKGNPAWNQFKGVPIGWVMENDTKEVVGNLSNIFSTYELNGKRFKAAVASSWVVDQEYRGESLALMSKFLYQKNVDLVINSTANLEAEKVLRAFKMKPVPTPNYDVVLFWITNYPGFLKSVLKKIFNFTIPLIHYPAGIILRIIDIIRKKYRIENDQKNIEIIHPLDPRMQQFWQHLELKSKRLLATRNSKTINWHYKHSFANNMSRILALKNDDGSLMGYIILKRRDVKDITLSRYQIVDLQVLRENINDIQPLLIAAINLCRREKIHVLEVVGFSGIKRSIFTSLRPYSRQFECWPFLYKAVNKELRKTLLNDDLWDCCLYDGDASLG
tara:strand:- start:293 stop:1429 length:1137 start_codon:yes stop_codon:yes gene_type:complete